MNTEEKIDKILAYVEELQKQIIFQNHKIIMLNDKIDEIQEKLNKKYGIDLTNAIKCVLEDYRHGTFSNNDQRNIVNAYIRELINDIKAIGNNYQIYAYSSSDALIVMLPEVGRNEVIEFVEKIYNLSKKD